MIAIQEAALNFSEMQFAKVMNAKKSKQGVNIDFSLAPEPARWEETLPEVCSESERWREAMDDEIVTMTKFGVYKKLPESAAGNRQILGCRWVYKRKTNKNGEVVRYRARLVAQGYRQREYDSFDPNSIFSPVVHKDTLRMFLSICAAENLRIFQADVKDAVHLKRLLIDLKLAGESPLRIMEDNSACIAQAEAGLKYVRNAKHYEVKLRFLQQRVVDKEVEFEYCPTDRQVADFFTKPLDEVKFLGFRKVLMSETT